MIQFTVPGNVQSKSNSARAGVSKGGKAFVYQLKGKKDYQLLVSGLAAKASETEKFPKGPVNCKVVLYLSSRRRVDVDNSLKSILDSLKAGGLLSDDSQIVELTVVKYLDKTNPRVEVTLSKATGEGYSLPPSVS
jgi:Holliday junction resolvase RusA-like endonuclease